jgi:hypothetical protein
MQTTRSSMGVRLGGREESDKRSKWHLSTTSWETEKGMMGNILRSKREGFLGALAAFLGFLGFGLGER